MTDALSGDTVGQDVVGNRARTVQFLKAKPASLASIIVPSSARKKATIRVIVTAVHCAAGGEGFGGRLPLEDVHNSGIPRLLQERYIRHTSRAVHECARFFLHVIYARVAADSSLPAHRELLPWSASHFT